MPTLAQVAALTESNNNPFLLRYEAATDAAHPQWIVNQEAAIQRAHGPVCSLATALAIACTSYGRYQILGANIWSPGGYTGDLFHFAFDDAAQDFAFGRFIALGGFQPDEDVTVWSESRGLAYSRYYNGPGDPAGYWARMRGFFW